MRIIIVGAGAIGSYLAERLSAEGQDVVVIEDDERRAAQLQETIDAIVLTGNGASATMLETAGVEDADLVIAVSGSDGANVLACFIASDLGAKTTIARIENPEIKEGADRLGVDFVIDPSATAANELTALIGTGGASELIHFAHGQLVMLGGIVTPNAPITADSLEELRLRSVGWGWVVAALVREGKTTVAHGDTTVRAGDHVLVMTTDDRINDAVRMMGLKQKSFERVVIMGGTRLAELTANLLDRTDMPVVIVEEDEARCQRLAAHHRSALIICGDPTDPDVIAELDLGQNDVVIALTGWDEVNVLSCLVAKAHGAGMVIARFARVEYVGLLAGVGIDAAISSRLMAASAILRFVRQGKVEQVATFSDTDAEAIEIEVAEGSPASDKTLRELELPLGVVVGGISRNGTTFVPDGSTVVRSGDHIIFFALPDDIEQSSALFSAN